MTDVGDITNRSEQLLVEGGWRRSACGQSSIRVPGSSSEEMKYYELITTKNVITAATGAGAIYLLAKTLLAVLRSSSFKSEPRDLARFSVEYRPAPCARATIPGELRRTLQSLKPDLDGSSKKAALHTITQCIFLKESEASTCTYDDIKLVASFLDDPDKVIRTETLNALKAFTSIWKFKPKIQEYIPKIMDLVVSNWDGNLQAAGLRLMNGLDIPGHAHPLLKRLLPNFMDILLMANILAKVQVLRLLNTMAQKEDLLYDIMNCQALPEFLSLFHPSLPGNLLYEMLVFVERLSEGRLTPQYQSMNCQYNNLSLHNTIFGENSRLSDRLLALIIHPEEEVQIQACKVILSLRLNKEDSKIISSLPFGSDISIHPIGSTRSTQPNDPALHSVPFSPSITSSPPTSNVIVDATCSGRPPDDTGHNFQPLQDTNDTSHSFYPLQSTGHNVRAPTNSSVSSHPIVSIDSNPVPVGPTDAFHPTATAYSEEASDNC